MAAEKNVIGQRIKEYRKLRGMLQEDLAEAAGINVSTIRKYEVGIRNPKIDQIGRIADALGVSSTALTGMNISSNSDILSLLVLLDNQTELTWSVERDSNGHYIPESIQLSFEDKDLNQRLATYLEAKKNAEDNKKEADSENQLLNQKIQELLLN